MALKVTKQERVFRFTKEGSTVTLTDPNPRMTVDQVLRFYSNQYPFLSTAIVEAPTADGPKIVFNIKTSIGTNG